MSLQIKYKNIEEIIVSQLNSSESDIKIRFSCGDLLICQDNDVISINKSNMKYLRKAIKQFINLEN